MEEMDTASLIVKRIFPIRDLTQKHVNLLQPMMFYQADSEQPIEVVINEITKNDIHGYVSAPMYRKWELASMSSAGSGAQAASTDAQPTPRRKLTPQWGKGSQ